VARSTGFVLVLGCIVGFGCAMAAPVAATTPDPKSDAKLDPKSDSKSDSKAGAKSAAEPKSAANSKSGKSGKSSKSKSKRSRRATTSIGAHTTNPSDADDTPAVRYAQLSQDECEAELDKRNIEYQREDDSPAVLAPVRLTSTLHGVLFRTDGSAEKRETSPYEIADCRLVLALDDFSQILERHDIVEVRHYSMYRPPHGWPAGQIGKQHAGALALDAGRFIDKDGKVLDVDHDFHGSIGAKTCGDGAGPRPSTPNGLALRAILCEAVAERIFNVVLTPNYNRPHHNHFHLEVMAGVRWFLVH